MLLCCQCVYSSKTLKWCSYNRCLLHVVEACHVFVWCRICRNILKPTSDGIVLKDGDSLDMNDVLYNFLFLHSTSLFHYTYSQYWVVVIRLNEASKIASFRPDNLYPNSTALMLMSINTTSVTPFTTWFTVHGRLRQHAIGNDYNCTILEFYYCRHTGNTIAYS